MAIKLPLFGKKDDDDVFYDYTDELGNDERADDTEDANMNFVTANEEPARTEQRTGFGGINESAVSLKVMAPKSFAEATKVADSLIAGSTVVLNIEAFGKADMLRFMDFLMGVLYVIRGNMKNVSKTTIVVSPAGIEEDVEPEAQEEPVVTEE